MKRFLEIMLSVPLSDQTKMVKLEKQIEKAGKENTPNFKI